MCGEQIESLIVREGNDGPSQRFGVWRAIAPGGICGGDRETAGDDTLVLLVLAVMAACAGMRKANLLKVPEPCIGPSERDFLQGDDIRIFGLNSRYLVAGIAAIYIPGKYKHAFRWPYQSGWFGAEVVAGKKTSPMLSLYTVIPMRGTASTTFVQIDCAEISPGCSWR